MAEEILSKSQVNTEQIKNVILMQEFSEITEYQDIVKKNIQPDKLQENLKEMLVKFQADVQKKVKDDYNRKIIQFLCEQFNKFAEIKLNQEWVELSKQKNEQIQQQKECVDKLKEQLNESIRISKQKDLLLQQKEQETQLLRKQTIQQQNEKINQLQEENTEKKPQLNDQQQKEENIKMLKQQQKQQRMSFSIKNN